MTWYFGYQRQIWYGWESRVPSTSSVCWQALCVNNVPPMTGRWKFYTITVTVANTLWEHMLPKNTWGMCVWSHFFACGLLMVVVIAPILRTELLKHITTRGSNPLITTKGSFWFTSPTLHLKHSIQWSQFPETYYAFFSFQGWSIKHLVLAPVYAAVEWMSGRGWNLYAKIGDRGKIRPAHLPITIYISATLETSWLFLLPLVRSISDYNSYSPNIAIFSSSSYNSRNF